MAISFYTDYGYLHQTNPWVPWGPLPDTSGSPIQRFFKVTEEFRFIRSNGFFARALAVCPGQLIVIPQEGNINKVNALLIPFNGQLSRDLPNIRYIIYRGLERSAFYGSYAGPNDPWTTDLDSLTNTYLSSTFLANLKADKEGATEGGLSTTKLLTFGADQFLAALNTAKVEDILTAMQANNIYTPSVTEAGMHFGFFRLENNVDIDGGIDFVCEHNFYELTVGDLRAPRLIIDAYGYTGATSPYNFNVQEAFEREKVRSFISPCLFFQTAEVREYISNASISDAYAGNSNLDKVVLNLSNEFGYGINFFRDYQNSATAPSHGLLYKESSSATTYMERWAHEPSVTTNDRHNWPLVILTASTTHLEIKLPTLYHEGDLVYCHAQSLLHTDTKTTNGWVFLPTNTTTKQHESALVFELPAGASSATIGAHIHIDFVRVAVDNTNTTSIPKWHPVNGAISCPKGDIASWGNGYHFQGKSYVTSLTEQLLVSRVNAFGKEVNSSTYIIVSQTSGPSLNPLQVSQVAQPLEFNTVDLGLSIDIAAKQLKELIAGFRIVTDTNGTPLVTQAFDRKAIDTSDYLIFGEPDIVELTTQASQLGNTFPVYLVLTLPDYASLPSTIDFEVQEAKLLGVSISAAVQVATSNSEIYLTL